MQQWFKEDHRAGKWKDYAVNFAGVEGVDLCEMTVEQIKSIVSNIAHGVAIFNDIAKLKKQASFNSESSPGSAAGAAAALTAPLAPCFGCVPC